MKPAPEPSRQWRDLVAPLVARCEVSAKFGGNAVWNPEGAAALGSMLAQMAAKMDWAVDTLTKHGIPLSDPPHDTETGNGDG